MPCVRDQRLLRLRTALASRLTPFPRHVTGQFMSGTPLFDAVTHLIIWLKINWCMVKTMGWHFNGISSAKTSEITINIHRGDTKNLPDHWFGQHRTSIMLRKTDLSLNHLKSLWSYIGSLETAQHSATCLCCSCQYIKTYLTYLI